MTDAKTVGDTERLLAINLIRDLRRLSLGYADQKNWSGFRKCFTDDATIDYSRTLRSWGEGAPRAYGGIDAFVDDVAMLFGNARTVHVLTMPVVEVVSTDEAHATWQLEDIVVRPQGAIEPGGHGFGRYEDKYRLTTSGWRISSSRLIRQIILPLPAGDIKVLE